jgi:DnaK suppressor protein
MRRGNRRGREADVSPTKLDRRTIGELEQFLRDELARLQGSLRAVVEENRTSENPSLTDITAHAAETLHTEMQVALIGRRTRQVVQIQDALERLSAGQYGHCLECDGFIGTARLRALPFAQRCRECQGHAERRARRESARAREFPRELEAA